MSNKSKNACRAPDIAHKHDPNTRRRTLEEIFASVYKAVTYAEATKLPKYASAVKWAKQVYDEEDGSEEGSEVEGSEEEGSKEAKVKEDLLIVQPIVPLDTDSVWVQPDYNDIKTQVDNIDAVVRDLSTRNQRLKAAVDDHDVQIATTISLLDDTKKNIEMLLVRLDGKKRARIAETM